MRGRRQARRGRHRLVSVTRVTVGVPRGRGQIVELHDESRCVLMMQLQGELPGDCNCSDFSVSDTVLDSSSALHALAQEPTSLYQGEIKETHGVPHPKMAAFQQATLDRIDQYTQVRDSATYIHARWSACARVRAPVRRVRVGPCGERRAMRLTRGLAQDES